MNREHPAPKSRVLSRRPSFGQEHFQSGAATPHRQQQQQQSYVQAALLDIQLRELATLRHLTHEAEHNHHHQHNEAEAAAAAAAAIPGGARGGKSKFLQWLTQVFLESMEDENKGGYAVVAAHPDAFSYILLYYVSVVAIAVAIITLLTFQTLSQRYLSAQSYMQGGECSELPRSVTATYQGDVFGNWETSPTFKQNYSAFSVQFVGTAITSTQYVGAMTRFKAQLKALSAKSANRDAGWNCVMWSSFFFKDVETSMSFYSTADASIVFRGNTMNGCLTSASAGVCPAVTQQGTFDAFRHQFIFTVQTAPVSDEQLAGYVNISKTNTLPVYSLVDFVVNAPWQDACPLHYPSYNWSEFEPAAQTGTMAVAFDIRTITSVMALNMDITPDLSQFTRVDSAFGLDASGGLPGSFYYNAFYAGMDPFFCLDKRQVQRRGIFPLTDAQVKGPNLCFLVKPTKYKPVFYYPVVSSFRSTVIGTITGQCQCPQDRDIPACNERNFVVGLFYDTDRGDMTKPLRFAVAMQQRLIDDPVNGDLAIQQAAYPVLALSYDMCPIGGPASANVNGSYDATVPWMPAGRTSTHNLDVAWASLCPWRSCSVFLFTANQDAAGQSFLALNKYGYQARFAPWLNQTYVVPATGSTRRAEMCQNTVYNDAMMDAFIHKAPVPLVEAYYQCVVYPQWALFSALGVGSGVTKLIATFLLLTMGYSIRHCRFTTKKRDAVAVTDERWTEDQNDRADKGAPTAAAAAAAPTGPVLMPSLNPAFSAFEHDHQAPPAAPATAGDSSARIQALEAEVADQKAQLAEHKAEMRRMKAMLDSYMWSRPPHQSQ